MALETFVGSFAWDTATGPQAVSGVGFQPKALIFFGNERTADGFATSATAAIGFAVSATKRGSHTVTHRSGFAQLSHGDDTAFVLAGPSALLNGVFDLTSMDADGFTIDISDLPSVGSIICNYIAIGGDDLTNVDAGSFELDTATGPQSVSGVGFQPDCVLFLDTRCAGTFPVTDNVRSIGLGWALSDTQRGAVAIHDNNTNPTQSESIQTSTQCIAHSDSGATEYLVDLTSMDADGFTLDVEDAPPSAWQVFYLALKGGSYAVGAETQATSATTKATSGLGFSPKGLILAGRNLAAGGSNPDLTNDRLSLGASDGANEGSVWSQSQDNVGASNGDQSLSRTKVIQHATNDTTVNAEADMQSFDADGFTLNWTTADATAREFLYLALGDEPAAAGASYPVRTQLISLTS